MKKITLLVVAFLGFTVLGAELNLSYGTKTGLAIANQIFDYNDYSFSSDYENRYGLDIGAFIEYSNNSNLHILFETHYIQKGMVYEMEERDDTGQLVGIITFNNRVDYLEFDVFGKLAHNFNNSSLYFILGPRIDLLLGHDSKFFNNLYDDFERFDFGGTFGLGYEFKLLESNNFLFEIRYSPSFTNSYKTNSLTVKNNSFEILTGIKFYI